MAPNRKARILLNEERLQIPESTSEGFDTKYFNHKWHPKNNLVWQLIEKSECYEMSMDYN